MKIKVSKHTIFFFFCQKKKMDSIHGFCVFVELSCDFAQCEQPKRGTLKNMNGIHFQNETKRNTVPKFN